MPFFSYQATRMEEVRFLLLSCFVMPYVCIPLRRTPFNLLHDLTHVEMIRQVRQGVGFDARYPKWLFFIKCYVRDRRRDGIRVFLSPPESRPYMAEQRLRNKTEGVKGTTPSVAFLNPRHLSLVITGGGARPCVFISSLVNYQTKQRNLHRRP